jgi:hypothetical protein
MITIILFILAGFFNSIMDVIRYRWKKSYFSNIKNKKLLLFCDPTISWRNKYKDGDPTKGEKFFASTTSLVFITDLWHLAKALMLICVCLGVVFYITIFGFWIDFLILLLSFTITFELNFSKFLIK